MSQLKRGMAAVSHTTAKSEIPEDQMNDFYRGVVWRLVSMSTVAEKLLYRLDEALRNLTSSDIKPITTVLERNKKNKKALKHLRSCPVTEEGFKEHMVYHCGLAIQFFDRYKQGLLSATMDNEMRHSADRTKAEEHEDWALDILGMIEHATNKRITSFVNAAIKLHRKTHPELPECNAYFSCIAQFTYVFENYFTAQMSRLGPGVQFPDVVPRAFQSLTMCMNKLNQMLDILIVNMKPSPDSNLDISAYEKQYQKLIDESASTDLINKCIDRAIKLKNT